MVELHMRAAQPVHPTPWPGGWRVAGWVAQQVRLAFAPSLLLPSHGQRFSPCLSSSRSRGPASLWHVSIALSCHVVGWLLGAPAAPALFRILPPALPLSASCMVIWDLRCFGCSNCACIAPVVVFLKKMCLCIARD